MKNKTKTIELNIGSAFVCALINSDDSGLNDDDKNNINEFIESYGPCVHVMMPDGEKSLRRCDISGLMDDCYACLVEVSK
jgi:hypothetical protein